MKILDKLFGRTNQEQSTPKLNGDQLAFARQIIAEQTDVINTGGKPKTFTSADISNRSEDATSLTGIRTADDITNVTNYVNSKISTIFEISQFETL